MKEHHLRGAIEALADRFDLSTAERLQLLPSGRYPTFDSRVGWASTYMKKAGLIEKPRRGYSKVTDRGLSVLKENPKSIDSRFLERYPEFAAFRGKGGESNRNHRRSRKKRISKLPLRRWKMLTRPSAAA